MTASFPQTLIFLFFGVSVVVVLTAVFRVHAFFALMLACFVVGLGVQLPVASILSDMKDGFGHTMQALAFLIVLGTTLGVLLESTGCTQVMANFIVRKTGERNASLGMSITGFIIGLPVFCDSGFVVLNGLNQSLAKRTGTSVVAMATSLATGLYAVHCLVPPHPGITAAAGTLGTDIGKLVLIGTAVALPGMIVGHLWAVMMSKKLETVEAMESAEQNQQQMPTVLRAFLPVLLPVILIGIHSLFSIGKPTNGIVEKFFAIAGDPIIALLAGVITIFIVVPRRRGIDLSRLLQESAGKAGGILVIIGAGGAFGAVLGAAKIGEQFSQAVNLHGMGVFFPFLLAFMLKTAQGSSTVAIITASSIVLPLLGVMGLDTPGGKICCVLAMGAGSMMISHANDAYFWVISKFSGLEMKTMLKTYSIASILMGLVTLLTVYLLSLIII